MSVSKVKGHLLPKTHTHTEPADCSTWTTRMVVITSWFG